MTTKSRLRIFQDQLDQQTAVLVSRPTDIFYLTGFGFLLPEEREAFLLVTNQAAALLHHSFSPVTKNPGYKTLPGLSPQQFSDNVTDFCRQFKIETLLIDHDNLVVTEWKLLQKLPLKVEALPKEWLSQQKMSKDDQEIAQIKRASQISNRAFLAIKKDLRVGQTEQAVAKLLSDKLRQLGSEREAFPTIVAFGKNTALPHHQPTTQPLTANQAILIDFGASLNGYRSDMTRSWWFGEKVDPEYKKILRLAKEAYQLGVKALEQPAPLASQVDQAVRTHINQAGYGANFIHTTGHGLGLDIHEAPSLYLTNHLPLPNRLVVTIEPGIYVPQKFGVRWENTLLLQDKRALSLTGK